MSSVIAALAQAGLLRLRGAKRVRRKAAGQADTKASPSPGKGAEDKRKRRKVRAK